MKLTPSWSHRIRKFNRIFRRCNKNKIHLYRVIQEVKVYLPWSHSVRNHIKLLYVVKELALQIHNDDNHASKTLTSKDDLQKQDIFLYFLTSRRKINPKRYRLYQIYNLAFVCWTVCLTRILISTLIYSCVCGIIDNWSADEYEIKLGCAWDYLSAQTHVSAVACVWAIQK